MSDPLVEVKDLTVRIPTRLSGRPAWVHASTQVSTSLHPGKVRALVGESGCGKSILGSTLIGMLPPGTSTSGSVRIAGEELLGAPESRWRQIRGRVCGLVVQSAVTSLTPTRTMGSQLLETVEVLSGPSGPLELCSRVGLPVEALACYPHELSGGMAQRAAVAFALAGDPQVVIADEPTASLDPELTDHVLGLLRSCAEAGAAVLVITHDLRSLERTGVADDLSVMYAGRIVEQGPAGRVLSAPEEAYTRALLGALPEHGMVPIPGSPPSLTDLDPSVTFADRVRGMA
ncbi:ABC transporter ATP-binding protein [Austwickia chelonae]|uniref:ABC transporter ATP-binding protein n=1 Tax=Austwickia chelonae TaxID=100225 RepID=UPI000E24B65A|nr:ABC transporter ATP-binding protein [Austwickia chelonae]